VCHIYLDCYVAQKVIEGRDSPAADLIICRPEIAASGALPGTTGTKNRTRIYADKRGSDFTWEPAGAFAPTAWASAAR
jgi:hypothetical protein